MQLKCLGNRRHAHAGSHPGLTRAATSHMSGKDNRLKFGFTNLEIEKSPGLHFGEIMNRRSRRKKPDQQILRVSYQT